jgi:hypothetical protein
MQASAKNGSAFFADAIIADPPLPVAFETPDLCAALVNVFGASALHPRSPFLPIPGVHFLPHEAYNFRLAQVELCGNSFERRAVFPRHLYDAVNIFRL